MASSKSSVVVWVDSLYDTAGEELLVMSAHLFLADATNMSGVAAVVEWNGPDSVATRENLGVVDVELERVQRNGLGVVGDVEVNEHSTVKGQLLEVGLKSDMVMSRDDVGGEKLSGLDVDPTSHFGNGVGSAHVVAAVRAIPDWGATKTKTY